MPPGEDCGVATTPAADAPATPSTSSDWASTMQALYGGGPATPGTPTPFYPPCLSPTPYIWGTQSVTYGTPISYPSFYPHGSAFAHPATSPGATVATRETKAKTFEALKKTSEDGLGITDLVTGNCGDDDKATSGSVNADPLGNAGPVTVNSGDGDKATPGSVNVDHSHRDESGGEESSRSSRDDENSPCDLSASGMRNYKLLVPAPTEGVSSVPSTSLNNGMNPLNSSHAESANMNGIKNTLGISSVGSTTVIRLNKAVPEKQRMQMQVEHEEKRHKRKLSNRESARRSRERKQKECEQFASQVAELNTENRDLRDEINKLNVECRKLEAENASIVEELKQLYGSSVLVAIEGEKISMPAGQILGVECNGQSSDGSNSVLIVSHNTI